MKLMVLAPNFFEELYVHQEFIIMSWTWASSILTSILQISSTQ